MALRRYRSAAPTTGTEWPLTVLEIEDPNGCIAQWLETHDVQNKRGTVRVEVRGSPYKVAAYRAQLMMIAAGLAPIPNEYDT